MQCHSLPQNSTQSMKSQPRLSSDLRPHDRLQSSNRAFHSTLLMYFNTCCLFYGAACMLASRFGPKNQAATHHPAVYSDPSVQHKADYHLHHPASRMRSDSSKRTNTMVPACNTLGSVTVLVGIPNACRYYDAFLLPRQFAL